MGLLIKQNTKLLCAWSSTDGDGSDRNGLHILRSCACKQNRVQVGINVWGIKQALDVLQVVRPALANDPQRQRNVELLVASFSSVASHVCH